ncbi:MAG: matrixin family metalloprotease [Acidobacteria bacterium]|nr:matrixin family metalloprotease [Acidobacteriota bacterium]MBI3655965.1 matrixin family metalloprotease [Acidobacteriota bacterium]
MYKKLFGFAFVVCFLAYSADLYAWRPLSTSRPTWPDGTVPFYVNPANDSGVPDDAVIESMVGGTDAWGYVGAGFNFCYQGTTTRRTIARDGFNDVFFRNETMGGAIAATYPWTQGGTYREFDIKFFEGSFQFFGISDACSGNGFYIWYIAMHEFGHGLGLGHSQFTNAVMYASARRCDSRVELESDDVDGVVALYGPGDGPGCF